MVQRVVLESTSTRAPSNNKTTLELRSKAPKRECIELCNRG